MKDFNDLIAFENNRKRVSQRDIEPLAVKSRALSDIAAFTNTSSVQTTLNNGEQTFISITVASSTKQDIIGAECYVVLYVDSLAGSTQLPGGSSIDESQWQVIGPFYDWNRLQFNDSDRYSMRVSLYVRNISAGAGKILYVRSKTKYLAPDPNAA